MAGVSLYWWRGDKEWKQEKSGRWGGNHVTWEDEYKLPSSYKIGSTGVRKVCSLPSPCLTDTITATSNSTSTTFHHSSFWAISPIIRSLTLAPEDRKKALGNNLGWFRNILWRYAVYYIRVSELAQLWEIVSSHSKPLGPLALTHVRLDKQTHAQERTSSAVFLCLSVFKAKLWREACMSHKYLVLLFCLLFHRSLGMYLSGSFFKMFWNSWMILKESLDSDRLVHSSDSQRSLKCYKRVNFY